MLFPCSVEKYLKKRYDPKSPGSFTSAFKLFLSLKAKGRCDISVKAIKEWMKSHDSIT